MAESKTSALTLTDDRKSSGSVRSRSISYERRSLSLVRLLLISLTSCCTCSSLAEGINKNTVIPVRKEPVSSKPSELQISEKTSSLRTKAEKLDREYICPLTELVGLGLVFSIPCKKSAECIFLGPDQICCKERCRRGLPAPPREPEHRAVLGVNRMCPKEPVPEILPVKRCESDAVCEDEGRICCPDKDLKLYCRTAAPVWSELPFTFAHPALMSLMGYMQCQPAPPALLNLFPQPCNRTIECLPNLCCQEGSGKFCRPAKKSVLSFVAQATQRFTRG